ncbi:hypothetical protein [Bradyrhizobium sp. SZCCHNRI1029]|uniref:hypothetical protein n=1 Tax=Bradyrhizobium sp. SZCCHNRI1029 TaxID=3057278 RepID=UPI002916B1EB|nr:hypothetical protein [Bradyrhizobium sp. SZCCHNRI1029]
MSYTTPAKPNGCNSNKAQPATPFPKRCRAAFEIAAAFVCTPEEAAESTRFCDEFAAYYGKAASK